MSTKTTFKRIALVAVAALGFGVLSVVPSQAAAGVISLDVVQNGTARLTPATGAGETSTGIIFTASSLLTAGNADSITVSFIATGNQPTGAVGVRAIMTFLDSTTASSGTIQSKISSSVIEAYSSATADSVTAGNAITLLKKDASSTPQIVGARYAIQLDSNTASTRVAGTYNFLIIAEGYSAGVKDNSLTKTAAASITILAAAAPAAAKGAFATAYLQAGATPTFTSVVGDSVTSGSLVAGTVVGQIKVTNASAVGVSAVDTITVSMTGPGYLTSAHTSPATVGQSFSIVGVADATLSVVASGVSGEGKITITTGTGGSFAKTVTFFDTKPVKATATVLKAFIKAGTGSVADVFGVVVTDTLGNAIKNTGAVVTAAATDTATTVGGAATCAWDATEEMYECAVAGKAADKFGPVAYTITATGTGVNAATKVTTTATVTFADNVATKAVLAGPASGTPGATVEYTLTLTEKNGYPVADQTYGVGGAGGALFAKVVASGWSTAPFATTDSFTAKSGVITSKGILPIAGVATGTWTLVGDGLQTLAANAIDKTIGKTTVTVSTDVANPGVDAATDAANEATDAANAATDAALAAAEAADAATTAAQEASDAVAALSASVTKLIEGLQAQIKSLAAVVAKIAKKVKA
jgi:hypothetical protein